jgi:membrane protein YdbS with pleckstrin-like domain
MMIVASCVLVAAFCIAVWAAVKGRVNKAAGVTIAVIVVASVFFSLILDVKFNQGRGFAPLGTSVRELFESFVN